MYNSYNNYVMFTLKCYSMMKLCISLWSRCCILIKGLLEELICTYRGQLKSVTMAFHCQLYCLLQELIKCMYLYLNIQRDTYNVGMPVNLTFPSWPENYVVSSLMLLPGRFIASLIFFYHC